LRDIPYEIKITDDPGALDAVAWDALVEADPDGNPFMRHAFLAALQSSGAATAATGWYAQYLSLWRDGKLQAAIPLYAKAHSHGEYVFDWAWADAQERMGSPYYPKWLVAVPFTPVAGTRILAVDAQARAAAVTALLSLVRSQELSSLHVLFAPPPQIATLAEAGMLVRKNVQFHWNNRGYRDFADFLDALTQPKRKKIRAERRKVTEAGVTLERRVGAAIRAADWRYFVRCYDNTYALHGGPPYLNLEFFLTIARQMPENLMLVLAYRSGQPIASALGVVDRPRGVLYGRYWGAIEPVDCLHFECCYYQMIDFAIEQGLQVFEGGAQGAHKLARGLNPVETQSAHWLQEPAMHAAVRRFVAREQQSVAASIDELNEHRALRQCAPDPAPSGAHGVVPPRD
jgi:predicted N-acyltransferase